MLVALSLAMTFFWFPVEIACTYHRALPSRKGVDIISGTGYNRQPSPDYARMLSELVINISYGQPDRGLTASALDAGSSPLQR